MKKQLILAAISAIAIASCNTDGFKKTDSGLKYKLFSKGEGKKPQEGDVLTMQVSYTVKTTHDQDSVLFDTHKQGGTIRLPMDKPAFKGGFEEGLAMLAVGDSACFRLSADSMFQKNFHAPVPPFVKKGSEMTFNVKLVSIQSKEELQAQMKQQREAFDKEVKDRQEKEPVEIADYIKKHDVKVKATSSGLYFIQTKAGSGPAPKEGQSVMVNYVGRFLDGRVFDSNIEQFAKEAPTYSANRPYEPIEIALGKKKVIPGWEEGLKLIKAGGKATLLMPSSIAYGSNGAGGVIPPYTPLVFDVEVVSIK